MNPPLTVECDIHFRRRGKGYRKELQAGPQPQPSVVPSGRVPPVSRLMALALRYEPLRSAASRNWPSVSSVWAKVGYAKRVSAQDTTVNGEREYPVLRLGYITV